MGNNLATKYRPSTFDTVVGQDSPKQILINQINKNDIKNGYLFTGGAGTGKTTMARIFANNLDGEIIEIDAASNNGVNEVRDIRERCKFKPMQKSRKVYIIDEVHMLSTGAFNALLKTLEEPPSHAVFILCTTDPQKIPSTILSRVQRFDFKRMTVDQVVERLSFIVNDINTDLEEVVSIENDVYEYIAKLANGGMRDSISLLDTCLSYDTVLDLEKVMDILGTTDYNIYIELLESIYKGNGTEIIEKIDDIHIKGKDLKQFIKGLVEFVVDLRKLLLFRNFTYCQTPSIYEDNMKQLINTINAQEDVNVALPKLFKQLNNLLQQIKYEQYPKTLIEGELLSLC